ncbi:hypothetical protein D3C84_1118710 [compost metagenome]
MEPLDDFRKRSEAMLHEYETAHRKILSLLRHGTSNSAELLFRQQQLTEVTERIAALPREYLNEILAPSLNAAEAQNHRVPVSCTASSPPPETQPPPVVAQFPRRS